VKDDTDERNRKSRAPIEGVAGPGEAGKPRPRWGEAPLGLSARSVLSGVTPQSPRPRTATHDIRKTRDARGRAGRNHAGFWVSPQSAQSMGVTSWGRTTREAPVRTEPHPTCSRRSVEGRERARARGEEVRKNPAASLSCSSSSSSSIAFLTGQTEDDDDHEHDQEKSRRFFIVLVLVVVLDCFPHQQTEDEDETRQE
jgi:hypothetical protein